ncbi:MAG: ATP-grasp enzyme [Actinomycetota bacterium]|nr:ATP-grasp enzyme [Actinomycetota bacterium]
MSSTASSLAAARTTLRTLGALGLLQLALPANAVLTAAAVLRGALPLRSGPRPAPPSVVAPAARRTVMVSGGKMTKALQLCRSFHAAGHRVVLVESGKYRLTGHRFSRSVSSFHVVPSPQDAGYAQALLDVVLTEGVDVYVPVCSPVASYYDAVASELLGQHCEVLHADAATIAALDDKEQFAELAASLGLPVPQSHRITDPDQVVDFDFVSAGRDFILKSIPYDPVHRLDLTLLPRRTAAATRAFAQTKPMTVENPWVMQEFVSGQEYCTHGTARNGRVQVYCCCESSAFQVNYESVDIPEIESWVTSFVEELGLTGQFSFDFMRTADGQVRAIECNPRTHSAITLFDGHPGLARGYLEDDRPLIRPLPSSRPTYWLYHELWRMLAHPSTAAERWRVVLAGRDAIFDWDDPLPFFMVHHVQIPWLLLQNLRHGKGWLRIDFNIGKLVEPAGD